MTTTATRDTTTTAFVGISRMEDAEPAIPFTATVGVCENNDGCSTPRPGTNQPDIHYLQRKEWRAKFDLSAKAEAKQTKHRRSMKTTTYYIPSTHPLFRTNLTLLGSKIAADTDSELLTQSDFEILKQALSRHRIRLEVSDVTDLAQLRADLQEAREKTSLAESATITAFAIAISNAFPDATAAGINPEKIAKLDPAYLSALQEFNENKYWVDAISREITRCSATPFRRLAHPISPTQHARIATSSRSLLSNILTPETCRRKFISLELLTKQIGKEFTEFLSRSERRLDRKRVADQIADSLAARGGARKA